MEPRSQGSVCDERARPESPLTTEYPQKFTAIHRNPQLSGVITVTTEKTAKIENTSTQRNVAQKLIADHLVDGEMTPGSEIALTVDQTLTQDATGTMVMQIGRAHV